MQKEKIQAIVIAGKFLFKNSGNMPNGDSSTGMTMTEKEYKKIKTGNWVTGHVSGTSRECKIVYMSHHSAG